PLIALGRAVRDDEHAAVVNVRRASPQEGVKFLIARSPFCRPDRVARYQRPIGRSGRQCGERTETRSPEQDGWYRGKGRGQERKEHGLTPRGQGSFLEPERRWSVTIEHAYGIRGATMIIIRAVFSLAVLALAGVLMVALSGHLWGRYQEETAALG